MNMQFPKKFFITGTDTGIGKTVISALLTNALDATYWKPIQAGLDEETDTEFVARVTNGKSVIPERYRLVTPMSPHGAADIDGVSIQLSDFELPDVDTEHLIVEGAGGLIVPINWEDTIIDLIKQFELPVLLVARSELGTLNHTLLSIEALRKRDIDIFGIVLNGPIHDSNRETLEHFSGVPVWEVEPMESLNKESLSSAFQKAFG